MDNKEVFFIVGMSKSGTTWLQNILNGHPNVICMGEGHFFNEFMPRLKKAINGYNESSNWRNKVFGNRRVVSCPAFSEYDQLKFLKYGLLLLWCQWVTPNDLTNISHLGEKTPENAFYLNFMNQIFKKFKVIHIIRDGRDAVASGWRQRMRVKPEQTFKEFSLESYTEMFSLRWVDTIQQVRLFKKNFPDRVYEVRYEDLLKETQKNIFDLLNFLKLNNNKKEVALCLESGSFERMSNGKKQGVCNSDTFFYSGISGTYRDTLTDEAIKIFETNAGRLLKECGYYLTKTHKNEVVAC